MSSFLKTLVAAMALAPAATAHMIINTPTPISGLPDNGPLLPDGSNFPCKFDSSYKFSESATENSFAIGSADNKLAFTGSAVHGGGSCQISLTYDRPPTKDSVWKVITSFEGGCPAKNMNDLNFAANSPTFNDPYTYNFTVPDGLEAGKYTLAWTWFNKIGNREMYMNCALATLEGSGGSKDAFNALPDMALANVNNIGTDCATPAKTNIKYSNPGDNVFVLESGDVGSLVCGPDSGFTAGAVTRPTGVASAPASSKTATPSKANTTSYAAMPTYATGNGGVFKETTASPSGPIATSKAAATSKATTTPAKPTSAPKPSSGTSGVETVGSACTAEGEWNCIGGDSYQRCASGRWSSIMRMANGLTCSTGVSAQLSYTTSSKVKRALRIGAKMLHI